MSVIKKWPRGHLIFFCCVAIFAASLRLYIIATLSPTLDEQQLIREIAVLDWFRLPAYFVGFGWGENILLALLAAPFVLVFSVDPLFAIRGIAFISNILFCVVLYLFVQRIVFDRRVARVALLFAAMWPWSIISGSIGFNVFLVPALFTSTFLLLYRYHEGERRPLFVYGAFALCAAAAYAYAASLLWIVMFAAIFIIAYRRAAVSKHHVVAAAALICVVLPIMLVHIKTQFGLAQPDRFLFFIIPDLESSRFTNVSIIFFYQGFSIVWHYLFNYFLHFVFVFLSYANTAVVAAPLAFLFDPQFWGRTPGEGLFFSPLAYIWDIVFIFFGAFVVVRNARRDRATLIISLWFFLYPVLSSFINADFIGFTVTRDIIGMPVLMLLSAIGAVHFFDQVRGHWVSFRSRRRG